MASNSTLDPDNFPETTRRRRRAQDTPALGPSDSTDSGSDLADNEVADTDPSEGDAATDRYGTGERIGARKHESKFAGDIETDRVVGEEEAGLGGGLDQAEEAQLGTTDEQLAGGDEADSLRKLKRRMGDLGGRRAVDARKRERG